MTTGSVYVYEWNAWEDFLLSRMFPDATRLKANVDDDHEDVLAQISNDCEWFIFHINLTDTAQIPRGRNELCAHLSNRGVKNVNERLINISKRRVQQACKELGLKTTIASRSGPPGERLIVKTNLNYGFPGGFSIITVGVGGWASISLWAPCRIRRVMMMKGMEERHSVLRLAVPWMKMLPKTYDMTSFTSTKPRLDNPNYFLPVAAVFFAQRDFRPAHSFYTVKS